MQRAFHERCNSRKRYYRLTATAQDLFDRVLWFGHSDYEPSLKERLWVPLRFPGFKESSLDIDGLLTKVVYLGGSVRLAMCDVGLDVCAGG